MRDKLIHAEYAAASHDLGDLGPRLHRLIENGEAGVTLVEIERRLAVCRRCPKGPQNCASDYLWMLASVEGFRACGRWRIIPASA